MLCCPLSASAGDAEVRHELLSSCSMRFEIWRFGDLEKYFSDDELR